MKSNSEFRILIVEDDVIFRHALEVRLSNDGFRVVTAPDGREGIREIVAFDPHLVISDWMMPHVDGLELCQSVKTGLQENAPYFILLSAKGEVSDRVRGLETGADDYLVKPCDHGEILARVRAGLRLVARREELRSERNQLEAVRRELEQARHELAGLAGTLPMCPVCLRVRTEEGTWEDLEGYLRGRSAVRRTLVASPACPAHGGGLESAA